MSWSRKFSLFLRFLSTVAILPHDLISMSYFILMLVKLYRDHEATVATALVDCINDVALKKRVVHIILSLSHSIRSVPELIPLAVYP